EVAGRHRTAPRQAVVQGVVKRGAAHRVYRIDAGADGRPHKVVDAALGEQVVRQLVVGDEADAVTVARIEQGQERGQIAGQRTLPYHQEEPGPQLLLALGQGGGLMV